MAARSRTALPSCSWGESVDRVRSGAHVRISPWPGKPCCAPSHKVLGSMRHNLVPSDRTRFGRFDLSWLAELRYARRRVGPEQLSHLSLVTSVEKTDARNAGNRIAVGVSNFRALATSACVRSGSDRTAQKSGRFF